MPSTIAQMSPTVPAPQHAPTKNAIAVMSRTQPVEESIERAFDSRSAAEVRPVYREPAQRGRVKACLFAVQRDRWRLRSRFHSEPRITFRQDELIHTVASDAIGGFREMGKGGARLRAASC